MPITESQAKQLIGEQAIVIYELQVEVERLRAALAQATSRIEQLEKRLDECHDPEAA